MSYFTAYKKMLKLNLMVLGAIVVIGAILEKFEKKGEKAQA